MDPSISALLELARYQGEQITKLTHQIEKQDEQISKIGKQVAVIVEEIQFMRDVQYDFQTQISRNEARSERHFNRYKKILMHFVKIF
ncbi:MAG: hypothetical protein ACRCXZ_09650 [Patescibacteria group bacterium]